MKDSISKRRIVFYGILVVLVATFLSIIIIPPSIIYFGKYNIYKDVTDVHDPTTGIVFGAGVTPEKEPTSMLADRLKTAIDLYNDGKINHIIVSGDNRTSHYNEPEVMANYLVEKGIAESAITLDTAGLRTYDTCYRANEVFELESALLITHGYHLPRALYLCGSLGVESTGFSATRRDSYPAETFFKIREIAAIYRSVLDVNLIKPIPTLDN